MMALKDDNLNSSQAPSGMDRSFNMGDSRKGESKLVKSPMPTNPDFDFNEQDGKLEFVSPELRAQSKFK